MYNWQHPDWPHFTYTISQPTDAFLYLTIQMASWVAGWFDHTSLDIKNHTLTDLMVSEAIKTSAIEGEHFDDNDIRSSIRNQLGLSVNPERVKDPRANGIAKLMIQVRQTFAEPLTEDMLFSWHKMIMTDLKDNGQWRTGAEPMQIVSGSYGHQKVHYEAPPSQQVPEEMVRFIKWFNETEKTLKGPIRAAIAHLYFESIHPFEDGNGRIGRAISEKALSQDLGMPVLLSLSSTIYARKKDYYQNLNEDTCGNMDITNWIEYFVKMILMSQAEFYRTITFIRQKGKFFTKYQELLNERQLKVVKRMFESGSGGFKGGISARKYMIITDCSKATATRDLTDMQAKGCLIKLPESGRSTRYNLDLCQFR